MLGSNVLELIDQLDARESSVAVIRHSARHDFGNLSPSEWDKVMLTDRGVEAAVRFGQYAAGRLGIRKMSVYGWGSARCQDTARAISEGASAGGCQVPAVRKISLGSPVADRALYSRMLRENEWEKMLHGWLDGGEGNSPLIPASTYAESVFSRMINEGVVEEGRFSIVATHDLYVMPLIRRFLGNAPHEIAFLDGIILKFSGDEITAAYHGSLSKLKRSEINATQ